MSNEAPEDSGVAPEEWAALHSLTERLASLSTEIPDVSARLSNLVDRIDSKQFRVAVVGEFNRGKSTLINALIGESVLPSGVLPLTMVATEVHFERSETVVIYIDGHREAIDPGSIEQYVTERDNPLNVKEVARVEVGVPCAGGIAVSGFVLVDTPGIHSVNEDNTATARSTMLEADGAVVVLSADSPLSRDELALIEELLQRHEEVFVVINKSDHVTEDELDEIRHSVHECIVATVGSCPTLYCVAARRVVSREGRDEGFELLQRALMRFVQSDLLAAFRRSALHELDRSLRRLETMLNIETASRAMNAEELRSQIDRFTDFVTAIRQEFDRDCIVLEHDVEGILDGVRNRILELVRSAVLENQHRFDEVIQGLKAHQLDDHLRQMIETSVRQEIDVIRCDAQEHVESRWHAAAECFTQRTQDSVDRLVEKASDLFKIHLPQVSVPLVLGQKSRFSYLFLRIEGPTAVIGHAMSRLMPPQMARHRALRTARRRLADELDKHAGRLRHDLATQLATSKAEYIARMKDELEQTQSSIVKAAECGANRVAEVESGEEAVREKQAELADIAIDIGRALSTVALTARST